jgi:hypothetical protein
MQTNEDIKNAPWYYGPIPRSECDTILSEKGLDGDFMVRDSETNVRKILFQQWSIVF